MTNNKYLNPVGLCSANFDKTERTKLYKSKKRVTQKSMLSGSVNSIAPKWCSQWRPRGI